MLTFYKSLFRRHTDEFSPIFTDSSEDALRQLADGRFDAAILDWDLPGINGLQLLKAIRANPATRALPVIFASGRASPDYEALALKHGASAYLAKPFETGKLLAYLRDFGRRYGDDHL